MSASLQKSRHPARKWVFFALRWGIAIFGIAYVLLNMSWRDTALVLNSANRPVKARLYESAEEKLPNITILDPINGAVRAVPKSELVNEVGKAKQIKITTPDGPRGVELLALDLAEEARDHKARRLLVADVPGGNGRWIEPSQVVGGFKVELPYPRIQPGIGHMMADARPLYVWLAVLVFPATFVITAVRWHALLRMLGIEISRRKAFVITMVGAFYNTFMPGSTGGDLLKAYYAAKHAPQQRTRAVISVIVDRAIGLLALVILGGAMAAYQWDSEACRRVAIGAAIITSCVIVGLSVFYHPTLRRLSGLDFLLRKLPMQRQVAKAVEAMELYRRYPLHVLGTLLMTFPVHMTVIVSAMFAGMAFDLPLHPLYYWVLVPVVVLAGAVPISPQGFGVMEWFAITLMGPRGCTVSQAFAMTMSIRLVQIVWNLVGGVFVLRGGYAAPTTAEQRTVVNDEDDAGPARPAEGVATLTS